MAPPPAYNPGHDWDTPKHRQHSMPSVEADTYQYGYSQDPIQRQNRLSVMQDMQAYNKKPRVTTYL
jgi:hypothetical protein